MVEERTIRWCFQSWGSRSLHPVLVFACNDFRHEGVRYWTRWSLVANLNSSFVPYIVVDFLFTVSNASKNINVVHDGSGLVSLVGCWYDPDYNGDGWVYLASTWRSIQRWPYRISNDSYLASVVDSVLSNTKMCVDRKSWFLRVDELNTCKRRPPMSSIAMHVGAKSCNEDATSYSQSTIVTDKYDSKQRWYSGRGWRRIPDLHRIWPTLHQRSRNLTLGTTPPRRKDE
jgi:hypothetical protein